jgi:DNA-binding Xre family transcriptional regulator
LRDRVRDQKGKEMITKHVREMAEKRGYTTAYQLRKALDISPTAATKLWSGEFEMIGLGTLDKLCEVLKCQPDKLLRYVSDVK